MRKAVPLPVRPGGRSLVGVCAAEHHARVRFAGFRRAVKSTFATWKATFCKAAWSARYVWKRRRPTGTCIASRVGSRTRRLRFAIPSSTATAWCTTPGSDSIPASQGLATGATVSWGRPWLKNLAGLGGYPKPCRSRRPARFRAFATLRTAP